MKLAKLLLTLLALTLQQNIFGGVNLKNGNFYVAYKDIPFPEIARIYNSKSTRKGFWGIGWGSYYETNLQVSADGSVLIYENGSGAVTRFTPKKGANAEAAAKKILVAMRKKSSMSEKDANSLIKKLSQNAELRRGYAKRFNVKTTLPKGTVLYARTQGLQELHVLRDGFERKHHSGKVESFNSKGKLIKIKNQSYTITLVYINNRLQSIRDSRNNRITFDWYSGGKVKALRMAGKQKATYQYKENLLVKATDAAGNSFAYSYDSNYNMTVVKYKNGQKMTISYEAKTQFARKIVGKNGEVIRYQYGANPKKPELHYWTTVSRTPPGKNQRTTKNRYEYEINIRPDGSRYTYRLATKIAGVSTETIYNQCCSLPIKITKGKRVTTFEYNKRGLLTRKASSTGDFVELAYHKRLDKIIRVKDRSGTTSYGYNEQNGNLTTAKNSSGDELSLVYDSKNRITRMIDLNKKKKRKKRILAFAYNALDKPIEISMKGIGKVNVAYGRNGEIKKIKHNKDPKLAVQVTEVFQSLLSIVQPAGVNLNI